MRPLLKLVIILLSASWLTPAFGQATDTTTRLKEVGISGYYRPQKLNKATSSLSVIDSNALLNYATTSLVAAFNTVAGVRMEERSPGSYRLSLRGSLLRSPFGIRNIKIYVDDWSLTDAGGNSYLNLLEPTAIQRLEIEKGPQASSYGANTGGAILASVFSRGSNVNSLTEAGSFGLFRQSVAVQHQRTNTQFGLLASYHRSDGYRAQSGLKRKYLQLTERWQYHPKATLKALLFYSDLAYETPGGLTLAQADANPKSARLATATLPSATTQQAAIFNKTVFGGISNTYQINDKLQHVFALSGSFTDFKNPFITNYEKRWEQNLSLRTLLNYHQYIGNQYFNLQLGLESGKADATINNFDNNAGQQGDLRASDKIGAIQTFGFSHINATFFNRLSIDLGLSLNLYQLRYQRAHSESIPDTKRNLEESWMPKFGISYTIDSAWSFRASASRGYSPPSVAEFRSSDQTINTALQAESGWNHESGFRYLAPNKRLFIDANVFYFNLRNAIVRRVNNNDAEYFINTGKTRQMGAELEGNWIWRSRTTGLLRQAELRSSVTLNHFRFAQYSNGPDDFSGNRLTGVPTSTFATGLSIELRNYLFFHTQYNYTNSLPLDDANTAFAKCYHLVDLKFGARNLPLGKTKASLQIGINNLLNQRYSLGNDLNAIGGRYYNPAPTRNFYVSLGIWL